MTERQILDRLCRINTFDGQLLAVRWHGLLDGYTRGQSRNLYWMGKCKPHRSRSRRELQAEAYRTFDAWYEQYKRNGSSPDERQR